MEDHYRDTPNKKDGDGTAQPRGGSQHCPAQGEEASIAQPRGQKPALNSPGGRSQHCPALVVSGEVSADGLPPVHH